MPTLPGMEGDVYFGDAEKALPDWRETLPPEEDTDQLTDEARASVVGLLGFDPQSEEEKMKPILVHRIKRSPFVRTKSLRTYSRKEGFTGTKKDKLGREFCYQDGMRVPCQGGVENPSRGRGGETQQNPPNAATGGSKPKQQYAPPPEGENVTKAPCCLYDPDPTKVNPETGITEHSRVGVPAMSSPPPPAEIPRLRNLTEKERAAEGRFAKAYLKDPDALVASYKKGRNTVVTYSIKAKGIDPAAVMQAAQEAGIDAKEGKDKKGVTEKVEIFGSDADMKAFMELVGVKGSPGYAIGDAPHIFNTDDAKLLSPDYNPKGMSKDEVKNARGSYNLAVHQTANALAKRAFIEHLDSVVSKLPDDKKMVLVTSGGVAAGKGYALKNIPETSGLLDKAGAVWDAAGEQNATENPWILEECRKRGIKAVFAFIHADPHDTWENPDRGVVERAGNIGRMVDARLFADSYSIGATNFNTFMDSHIDDPDTAFYVINNATGGAPTQEQKVPEKALNVDSNQLYRRASDVIKERAGKLKPYVVRGGTIGQRVWGHAPEPTTKGLSTKSLSVRVKSVVYGYDQYRSGWFVWKMEGGGEKIRVDGPFTNPHDAERGACNRQAASAPNDWPEWLPHKADYVKLKTTTPRKAK